MIPMTTATKIPNIVGSCFSKSFSRCSTVFFDNESMPPSVAAAILEENSSVRVICPFSLSTSTVKGENEQEGKLNFFSYICFMQSLTYVSTKKQCAKRTIFSVDSDITVHNYYCTLYFLFKKLFIILIKPKHMELDF